MEADLTYLVCSRDKLVYRWFTSDKIENMEGLEDMKIIKSCNVGVEMDEPIYFFHNSHNALIFLDAFKTIRVSFVSQFCIQHLK